MRILFVVPLFASFRCFLSDLAGELADGGWEVHLACDPPPAGDSPVALEPIHFHPIRIPRGIHPIRLLKTATDLRRVVRRIQPDLIHAHFSAGMLATAAGVPRKNRPLLLATIQGLGFPLATGWKRWLLRQAEVWSARRMDKVWVLTADDLGELAKHLPTGVAALQESYGFGARDRFFDEPLTPPDLRESARARLGVKPGDRLLLFVGRWTDFKGFPAVLRTFWQLSGTESGWKLLLVGEEDPFHSTGLDARETDRLRTDEAIIRTGWREDVLPYLDLADLMLFPSEREGMPVSVMEALARGLPVVAHDVRGCRELAPVSDGRMILSEKGPENLAGAVRKALGHNQRSRYKQRDSRPGAEVLRRSRFIREQIANYRILSSAETATAHPGPRP